jgi:hypothetical protein
MSLQDDIFDVEDALVDTPQEEQFGRITSYLSDLEADNERLSQYKREVTQAFTTLRSLLRL